MRKNWTMVIPEKAALVTRADLEDYWPCADGLSAVTLPRKSGGIP